MLNKFGKVVVVPEESLTERADLLRFDFVLLENRPSDNHFLPVHFEQQCGDSDLEVRQSALNLDFHAFSVSPEGEYFLGKVFPEKKTSDRLYSVNFQRNSSSIDELDKIRIWLSKRNASDGSTSFVLRGEADAVGSNNVEYNTNLALRRICLLYTSPSPRDQRGSRMPSSA